MMNTADENKVDDIAETVGNEFVTAVEEFFPSLDKSALLRAGREVEAFVNQLITKLVSE